MFVDFILMIPARIIRIIKAQTVVTVAIGSGSWLVFGAAVGMSSTYGGAVGVFSALAYAVRSSLAKGKTPEDWLKAQYAGEKLKFAVTVILIIAVAKGYPALHWLAFLIGFMSTMLVYFLALLWDV